MATIGQTLSAARIAAGCSLEHLSTRTGIRMRILKAIEGEDFIPCGGDFYARGHIRRISGFLGVDPGALLEEYEREHASKEKPTFVPSPRKVAATVESTRSAAAPDAEAHAEATVSEETRGDAPRLGDDELDPEQRAERWGHFERNQKLAQRTRPADRPRKRRAETAQVPPPRSPDKEPHVGAHRRPEPDEEPGERHSRDRDTDTRGQNTDTLTQPPPIRAESGMRRHWPWAVVGLILIAAVFVGVRTWQSWEEGNPARTAFDTVRDRDTGEEAMGSATLSEQPAGEQARMAEEVAEPTEFTVELIGAGRSWVQVTDVEGEDLFTGFLVEGQSLDYVSDHPLTVQFGNAGMVGIAIDGEDLGTGGHFGEVREVTLGAQGLGH